MRRQEIKAENEKILAELDYRQLWVARKLLDKAIKYATLGNYPKLEKLLEENKTSKSEVHDMVARVALRCSDKKLFNMTDHHTRIILSDFAGHEELFPRLLEWYFESGHEDKNGVPSYVWEACTFENAKLQAFFTGEKPEDYILAEKGDDWKQYFG